MKPTVVGPPVFLVIVIAIIVSRSWPFSTIILRRSGGIGYAASGARIELCLAIVWKSKDLVTEVVDIVYRTFPNTVDKSGVGFEGLACEGLFVKSVGGKTVQDA